MAGRDAEAGAQSFGGDADFLIRQGNHLFWRQGGDDVPWLPRHCEDLRKGCCPADATLRIGQPQPFDRQIEAVGEAYDRQRRFFGRHPARGLVGKPLFRPLPQGGGADEPVARPQKRTKDQKEQKLAHRAGLFIATSAVFTGPMEQEPVTPTFLEGPLWVFGYGSLIWDPGFPVVERRIARVDGWHRSFCMRSIHHRGTPDAPGLVLALDRADGATCTGVAFRVAAGAEAATLTALRERELVSSAYLETGSAGPDRHRAA